MTALINVAIVEDDGECSTLIASYLQKYAKGKELTISSSAYANGSLFLSQYKPIYDIVLLDIQLPSMSGLEVADRLRQIDEKVIIVFITNMRQLALEGYRVNAIDFVVKPVQFERFSIMMDKAMRIISSIDKKPIMIHSAYGEMRVDASDIFYVEVYSHHIIYHLSKGNSESWGTLSSVEEKLASKQFSRCTSSVLVNLSYVESIEKDSLVVHGEKLHVARSRRAKLMEAFAIYMSNWGA
jgi:DNA-binding LytR/AlgR family response regulator